MSQSGELKIILFTFRSDRPILTDISKIRGFFASHFKEFSLFHQHYEDKLMYQYPLVQYKLINNIPVIMGINDGAELLKTIYNEFDSISLGTEIYSIFERKLIVRTEKFGLWIKKMVSYRFVTPWYALNQKNYQKYQEFSVPGKISLLKRILIGNILSMSRGVDYDVPHEIICQLKVKPRKILVKNTRTIGFTGTFAVNFQIPNYLGLGKLVSRGLGMIQKVIE